MKKETARQHYKNQLETLHDLLWEMDCFHVEQFNRLKTESVSWGDCGKMAFIIEQLKSISESAKVK